MKFIPKAKVFELRTPYQAADRSRSSLVIRMKLSTEVPSPYGLVANLADWLFGEGGGGRAKDFFSFETVYFSLYQAVYLREGRKKRTYMIGKT